MKRFCFVFLILLLVAPPIHAQITIRPGGKARKNEEKTKNIHGVVLDQSGKPIAGAHVLIRNTKDFTTRTLTTDQSGSYNVRGLPPDVNYEVRADFNGMISDVKNVSAMLDREDNLINFQLNLAVNGLSSAGADSEAELRTFDLVKLKASFEIPRAVPAPIPAVLLLHGYGEDRKVWDSVRAQFLDRGWAVMSLDLRGHGESKTKNQKPIEASTAWRTSPHEFPLDVDPALDWLKAQTRINSRKIVIVGYDVGANLALVSSGKFSEVRTVVAVNPNAAEALQMSGSAQDFHPHSTLVVTTTPTESDPLKPYIKEPSRFLTQPVAGGTAQAFQSKVLVDAVFQWLKETY